MAMYRLCVNLCPYCIRMNAVHGLGSLWSLYLCCSGCWKCEVCSFQAAQDEEGARDFTDEFCSQVSPARAVH